MNWAHVIETALGVLLGAGLFSGLLKGLELIDQRQDRRRRAKDYQQRVRDGRVVD